MSYKTYENYKDSGIEWIGKIPSGWDLVRNKNLFIKSKVIVGQQWENFPVLSLTKKGVIFKDIELNEGKMPSDFSIYQIVNPGNLLLCLFDIDVTPRCVGFIKDKGIVSAAYSEIKAVTKLFMKYYFYWYLNLDFDKTLLHLSKNLRNSLSNEDFMALPIVKPPIDEQVKIARYLDKKTLQIDENIAKNKELISLLEEKKAALINQVVTKGLDPNVPMKDSGIEWIGEIPEHWEVSKLNRYANVTKLAGFEFTKYIRYIPNGEVIALRALNIKNNKLNLDNIVRISKEVSDNLPRSKLYKGDIIFTYVGAKTGAVALIDKDDTYHLAPNIAKITNYSKDSMNTDFLLYLLSSHHEQEEIWLKISKSGQEAISMEKIRTLSILIPPLEEQKDIVVYLEKHINNLNKIISKCQKNIRLLEEYKSSLIYHVVTGKIDVRDEV